MSAVLSSPPLIKLSNAPGNLFNTASVIWRGNHVDTTSGAWLRPTVDVNETLTGVVILALLY